MTFTQIEYILAVNRHRHFGKAAKACFVTQPTLSMQIQKLEAELGLRLFDRSKSPVLSTVEGTVVIEQAKVVIREKRRLTDLAEQARGELSGDFRLAVIPTLSPYVLPLFLRSFVREQPTVNLIIEEFKTEQIIESLHADEIDAGLLVTPLHEDSLTERVLFYEPFYLFVAPEHPLAKKRHVSQTDLDIREIWLLNKGNCFRDQVLRICAEHSPLEPRLGSIRFESGNLETLKNMVLCESGYTILPHLAVKQLAADHAKLVRDFLRPSPTREVSLVFGRNVLKKRVLDALEKAIVRSLPNELRKLHRTDVEVVEIDV